MLGEKCITSSNALNVGGFNYPSLNSSNGIAFEIYLSGCSRSPKCKGCHNPELWDFNKGIRLTIDEIIKIINSKKVLDNIVIMGGEPVDNPNLIPLLHKLKAVNKNIWLYTSYELHDISDDIKKYCSFIKTGQYIEELKINDCMLATLNQKIYERVGDDFELYYACGKQLSEVHDGKVAFIG